MSPTNSKKNSNSQTKELSDGSKQSEPAESVALRPIIDIYRDTAEFWAKERAGTTFFEKKYMNQILKGLSPGDLLLDLGCGSGYPIADFFLKNNIRVTGVDAVPEMLMIASEAYPQAGAEWLEADMRSLSLNRKFNAIIAWNSFFHLTMDEQRTMFPIFRAHLVKGGRLLFTSGPEAGEAIGDMDGNALFHASLAPEEYRSLLAKNSLKELSFTPKDPECGEHTVWFCEAN